jgi:glycolate oxidase FAD binding subunit
MSSDLTEQFAARIRAASREAPLRLRGGGSKDFYGGVPIGAVLDTRAHAGIVAYEPTELVITARAGTPLVEIEAALAAEGQFLAFEPPAFGGSATIGGVVAAGLSGPRRAAVGAVRDFVLGVRLLDGEARVLSFGGQVMKNVAGYDVSRLVAGSLGTLGVILAVSLKVLPRPVAELSLRFEMPEQKALDAVNAWAGRPLPVVATCWHDDVLTVHLSGAGAAVMAARERIGGEALETGPALAFWRDLRDQRLDFFTGEEPLWRFSLPSVAAPLSLPGPQLIEWGGAQRWLRSGADAARLREISVAAGGHATLFRGGDKSVGTFQPLPATTMEIHRRLKTAFDPRGVLNPGRLYPDF